MADPSGLHPIKWPDFEPDQPDTVSLSRMWEMDTVSTLRGE